MSFSPKSSPPPHLSYSNIFTCFLRIKDDRGVPVRQALDDLAGFGGREPDVAVGVAEVAAGHDEVDRDPPARVVRFAGNQKSFLKIRNFKKLKKTFFIVTIVVE